MPKRFIFVLALAGLTIGCTTQKKETPEDIREKTANATAELKENTKAVVEGVKEGLHRGNGAVDLNQASKGDLASLPGMTSDRADRVIAARPYDNPHQLVSRRILPQEEYDRIKYHITVAR